MAETSQYSLSKKRRRAPTPWPILLLVDDSINEIEKTEIKYDLPEQKIIEKNINELLAKSNISENEKKKTFDKINSIVTYYSKKSRLPYKKNNGWLNLLLLCVKMSNKLSVIFQIFETIQNKYIPFKHNCEHTLRLLFIYHDPELAQFIVRKRVSFHEFSAEWTASLFAGLCEHDVVHAIWSNLFQNDGSWIFYFILIYVINHRSQILSKTFDNKDTITKTIAALPKYLNINMVSTYFGAIRYYKQWTPFSFENEFFLPTFGSPINRNFLHSASAYICLPLLNEELLISKDKIVSMESSKVIEFIVVDLRPVSEFNAGHYPKAVNLDYTLHFEDPLLFANKVDEILDMQSTEDKFAYDRHFCFMGSGREEDDMFITTFIDPILELRVKYISVLKNGYQAIHHSFSEDLDKLENHNFEQCLICNPNFHNESSGSQPKLTTLWEKVKKMNFADRENPNSSVSSRELNQDFRIISIEECSKNPQKLHLISGTLICKNSEKHDCKIFITENSIHVLRLVKKKDDLAYLILRCSLEEVQKLSQPKDNPNVLKMHYDFVKEEKTISRCERFIIPNPQDVNIIVGIFQKLWKKSTHKNH